MEALCFLLLLFGGNHRRHWHHRHLVLTNITYITDVKVAAKITVNTKKILILRSLYR